MTYPLTSCLIWGGSYNASGLPIYPNNMARVDDSPRTGGGYMVPWPSTLVRNLSDKEKARLTTWLVDQRMQGVQLPEITTAVVDYVKAKRPLSVHKRADRLLQYLSNLTSVVGEYVALGTQAVEPDPFGHRAMSEGPTSWEAMAWSESIQALEIQFLVDYLLEKGWTAGQREGHGMGHFTVTVDGYSHIADQAINVDSSQAFVAMWFDPSLTEADEKGIKPAVVESGYIPLRIDQKEHINKIDDELIAEIRRSRFLVADFTQGPDGARGGVYYEAGFARGLDLPVIFTCKKDSLKDLHFDTEHYNHIVWTNEAELREKLRNRILAAIGEGPGLYTTP